MTNFEKEKSHCDTLYNIKMTDQRDSVPFAVVNYYKIICKPDFRIN